MASDSDEPLKGEWVSQESPGIAAGTTLFNHYRIVRPLGAGASGQVYLAIWNRLGKDFEVALKLFSIDVLRERNAATRLGRELQSLFKIENPHVTRFYESVRDENYFGISLEYVEGNTLRETLMRGTSLLLSEKVRILIQIAKGLHATHAAKVVHRDLKPANILIAKGNLAKITDFGLALAFDDPRIEAEGEIQSWAEELGQEQLDRITNLSGFAGTPRYISPEYILHGILDNRSDIYSFGVIAFELLSETLAFDADSLTGLMRQKVVNEPPNLLERAPNCPAPLVRIVCKAMEIDPEERYQDIQDALRDLSVFRSQIESEVQLLSTLSPKAQKNRVGVVSVLQKPLRNLKRFLWGWTVPLLVFYILLTLVLNNIKLPKEWSGLKDYIFLPGPSRSFTPAEGPRRSKMYREVEKN